MAPPPRLSRRSAFALAAAGLVGACAPARSETGSAAGTGLLRDEVDALTRAVTSSMPYRNPRQDETDALVAAVVGVVGDDDARRTLERFSFGVAPTVDDAGRRHLTAVADSSGSRSWGLVALPLDTAPRLVVEVPHPVADRDTEELGLDLVAAAPGAILVQAGAHRRAGDGRADVAHETSSLFHAVVTRLATDAGLPQVQVHGFDDGAQERDVDVVLSPGAAAVTPLIEAAGDALDEAGHAVCRVWSDDDCPDLAGRTNVQGRAAARAGLPFLHVELGQRLREEADVRAGVARALARAVGDRG